MPLLVFNSRMRWQFRKKSYKISLIVAASFELGDEYLQDVILRFVPTTTINFEAVKKEKKKVLNELELQRFLEM